MCISRKDAIKEFMKRYKQFSRIANSPDVNKYMLYYELRGFYNGMTSAISYDDNMSSKEYKLIYTFMLRKLDTFFNVYVLNK